MNYFPSGNAFKRNSFKIKGARHYIQPINVKVIDLQNTKFNKNLEQIQKKNTTIYCRETHRKQRERERVHQVERICFCIYKIVI